MLDHAAQESHTIPEIHPKFALLTLFWIPINPSAFSRIAHPFHGHQGEHLLAESESQRLRRGNHWWVLIVVNKNCRGSYWHFLWINVVVVKTA
jgi:hypothetical protein